MRDVPFVVTVQTASARPRSSRATFGHPIISGSPLPIVIGSGGCEVIGIQSRATTIHAPAFGVSTQVAMLSPRTFAAPDGRDTPLPALLIEVPGPAVPTPTKSTARR